MDDIATLTRRARRICAGLDLDTKCRFLAGATAFQTVPIPAADIPALLVTDGPLGVRTMPAERAPERMPGPATAMPSASCMAATWDTALIREMGAVLGTETRALGCDILLGPGVNLIREPRCGRVFEYFSEDPLHSALLGCAYVDGVQSVGVGTCVKHFVANDLEQDRYHSDSIMDERTLREIHLLPFEWIAQDADPWSIMTAYNKLGGVYCTDHLGLLQGIFRDELGYPGVVISDWGAVHTTEEAVIAGTDLQMWGPDIHRGAVLAHAVSFDRVPMAAVDACVVRMLALVLRCQQGKALCPQPTAHTPEHAAVSRRVAEAGHVLLKNEDAALPIDAGTVRTIALIGPNAEAGLLRGGGSSRVFPEHWVSLVEGMRAECGDAVEIVVAQGCSNQVDAQPLVADVRRADGEPGYDAAFHAGSDPQGEPAFTRTVDEAGVGFFNPAHNDLPETWCAVFSATWKPRYTGRWKFILGARGGNRLRLLLDGQEVAALTVTDDGVRQSFLAKQAVHVEVGPGEHRLALAVHGGTHASLMADYDPEPAGDGRLEEAVALARQADAVVLALGNPCHYESEGSDRPDLRLPGRQDELAEAVLAARPDAAVLLTSGAPLELPWVDRARAILLAHLPGQAGGRASARVLLGRVNPGGRLPHTWPRRIQDTPAITGSGYKRVVYGETVWVGHRWYDARAIEPLFPFGHGLSYTTFAWSDLQLRERIDPAQDTELRLAIRNTGGRDGDEIVQCYIEPPPDERLPRPLRQLAGFSRVPVAAGEMVTATVRIPWRAWRIWDPDAGGWTIPTGEYGIVLGASSRDLRLRTTITIDSVTQDQAGGFTAADAHLQA